MTYTELKARLTKCEVKLKEIQSQNSPARKSKNYNTAVEKLNILKESLKKQIKEIKDKQDNTGGAMAEPLRRGAEDRFQFFASSSDSSSPITMTRSICLSRNRVSRRVRPSERFQRQEQDVER